MSNIAQLARTALRNSIRELGVRSDDTRSLHVRSVKIEEDLSEAVISYERLDGIFEAKFTVSSAQDAVDYVKKLDRLFV